MWERLNLFNLFYFNSCKVYGFIEIEVNNQALKPQIIKEKWFLFVKRDLNSWFFYTNIYVKSRLFSIFSNLSNQSDFLNGGKRKFLVNLQKCLKQTSVKIKFVMCLYLSKNSISSLNNIRSRYSFVINGRHGSKLTLEAFKVTISNKIDRNNHVILTMQFHAFTRFEI